jgi:hypothetical protein
VLDNVFIVPFHVKRAPESIMPENVTGAYVSCYAAADSYEIAVERCLSVLQVDGMRVEEILQPINAMSIADWSRHIAEQWPDQVGKMPSQQEFESSVRGGSVVYGPFGSY